MIRTEWKFRYSSQALADAAEAKKMHHQARAEWWSKKQEEVIAEVKEKGLEVAESLSMQYGALNSFVGASAANKGAQLVVKNDYQTQLNECHTKINQHSGLVKMYDGWIQVLLANKDDRLDLDIEDYLFFFGK
jgi:hypothetical protein